MGALSRLVGGWVGGGAGEGGGERKGGVGWEGRGANLAPSWHSGTQARSSPSALRMYHRISERESRRALETTYKLIKPSRRARSLEGRSEGAWGEGGGVRSLTW